MPMPQPMPAPEEPAGEASTLRRDLRDVAALSTLPAIWIDYDPAQIAESLAGVLARILPVEFAYVRLGSQPGRPPVEAVHQSGRAGSGHLSEIRRFITECGAVPATVIETACPSGGGMLRVACAAAGADHGAFLACASRQPDFPADGQKLVLSTAASQAAIALQRWRAGQALREQTARLQILNRIAAMVASKLDLESIVQTVTDGATKLCGAQFGAFFYNATDQHGENMLLYTLSGAPREAFAQFPVPRPTAVFGPTFRGSAIVRSDNIREDPRYGKSAPHYGMPAGHLPVVSYLGVPVISGSGEVTGGLIFGHEQPGVFTAETEQLAAGIAAHAAIAIDNARLFQSSQSELAQRRTVEKHQNFLLHELNHRVKNTLATVQSLAVCSFRDADGASRNLFTARLMALSNAYDLLSQTSWQSAALHGIIRSMLAPHGAADPHGPFRIEGPEVRLPPKMALAFGMVLHELATNSIKYGALSHSSGSVRVTWHTSGRPPNRWLRLRWMERGGPTVEPPQARGFGSRIIEDGLSRELGGEVTLAFEPGGVICNIRAPFEGETMR